MFKIFVLILAFCSITSAQRLLPGNCPDVSADNDFDIHKFIGKWILTETTPSFFDFILKCMEMDYENQKDGTLAINLKGISFANLPVAIKGDGVLHDTSKNGHYNIRYAFGVPFQGSVLSIVDTDYQEYAVLYSCTNSILPRLLHTEHIWVVTKNGVLTNPSRQNIYTKIDQLKINRNGLTVVDRSSCKPISNNQREGDLANLGVRSNLTNIDNNMINNIVGSAREEAPTENPIKVS